MIIIFFIFSEIKMIFSFLFCFSLKSRYSILKSMKPTLTVTLNEPTNVERRSMLVLFRRKLIVSASLQNSVRKNDNFNVLKAGGRLKSKTQRSFFDFDFFFLIKFDFWERKWETEKKQNKILKINCWNSKQREQ